MARNEIRIRKKVISPDDIDQHKNYSGIVRKHERYLKLQGLLRFIIYFTIAVIFMVIILFVWWRVREEQYRKSVQEKTKTSLVAPGVSTPLNHLDFLSHRLSVTQQPSQLADRRNA
jgi:hypothetical protein